MDIVRRLTHSLQFLPPVRGKVRMGVGAEIIIGVLGLNPLPRPPYRGKQSVQWMPYQIGRGEPSRVD